MSVKKPLVPPKYWEEGLTAHCWHCNTQFKKTDYCPVCGYYKCPVCHKCGCHLSPEQRQVVDKTFEALAPIFEERACRWR